MTSPPSKPRRNRPHPRDDRPQPVELPRASAPLREERPGLAAWRFGLELAVWAMLLLAWGPLAAITAILLLMVLSTPGDKKTVVIPVNGLLRLLLECLIQAVGVVAAWLAFAPDGRARLFLDGIFPGAGQGDLWQVLGPVVALGLAALCVGYWVADRGRLRWLLAR